MPGLDKLSDDDLAAENQRLMAEKDELRGRQEEIRDELSRRAAARFVEGLSDAQLKAIQGVAAEAKGGRG